jgi:hypothetical protein
VLPSAPLREQPGWEARWDFPKMRARLAWIEALRIVYANALELLGVSAPERMDRPQQPQEAEAPTPDADGEDA